MATSYLTVEDNTAPILYFTLKRNGSPIDLTGATVNLIIKNKTTGDITNTGHQGCDISDDNAGVVTYTRVAADIPNGGNYICEVRITYSDNTIETMYEQLSIIARKKLT